MGDMCFRNVKEVKWIGLSQLEKVVIGKKSFTRVESDEEIDFKRTVDVVRSIQSVPVLLRAVICGRSDLPEAVHTCFAGYTGCRVCVHGSDSLDFGGI